MPVTYAYEMRYELCALVFLVVLSAHFFLSPRFPSRTNQIFGIILGCAILDLSLDLLGSLLIENPGNSSVFFNLLVNGAFYMLQVIIPTLMLVYVIYASGRSYRRNKRMALFLIPAALFLVLQLTNPVTRLIFYLEKVDGALLYYHGPLFPFLYINSGFYMLCTAIAVWQFRKDLTAQERRIILGFLGIVAVALLIQIWQPYLLLTGTAMTLSIILMMFTIQNPDDLVDTISGAFNYNALLLYLDDAIQRGKELHLIVVEVEGIESINRMTGLLHGNAYVAQVCSYFRELGGNDLRLFRVVSSRFLLSVDSEEEMRRIAAEVERRFTTVWQNGSDSFILSANVVSFRAPSAFHSPDEFVSFMDEVVALGSEKGRHYRLEDGEALLRQVRRRQAVEELLRAALRSGSGLSVYYQPIRTCESGSFDGAEILTRLRSEELGRVSPDEFIPVAEECGLAPQLDTYVIRRGCAFLHDHPGVGYLDINLSAANFYRDPTEELCALVAEYGVEPERIRFEITETASARYPETLREFMDKMIARGFRFALDDFGTGYANITQVNSLPLSEVKLDRSLLAEGEKARALLGSLFSMFRQLGLPTVMEGVETEEQFEFATGQGADYIQGFYFARPMPESEYALLLGED